ncbi:DNA polymerase delta, subunit 4-domain-containing protein [Hysterangium stoloniferum]|nr:DNA polymerase delta, subunit 4-domain-containing protein [Hysterangium stoloniferum]
MAPKRTSPKKSPKSQQHTLPFKATKRGAASSSSKAKQKQRLSKARQSDKESPTVVEDEIDDRAKMYKKYYEAVKQEMGGLPPIHSKDESNILTMLRVFDNTYDYGPCVGMTRMERWERAEALGLNPPIEVRQILLCDEGRKEPEVIHPVFRDQVL